MGAYERDFDLSGDYSADFYVMTKFKSPAQMREMVGKVQNVIDGGNTDPRYIKRLELLSAGLMAWEGSLSGTDAGEGVAEPGDGGAGAGVGSAPAAGGGGVGPTAADGDAGGVAGVAEGPGGDGGLVDGPAVDDRGGA